MHHSYYCIGGNQYNSSGNTLTIFTLKKSQVSSGVKARPITRNISTQHIPLLLDDVGPSLKMVKFLHNVVLVWPRSCKHNCAGACALVRFAPSNIPQHIATGWPNGYNMLCTTMLRAFGQLLHNISHNDPTILGYFALKVCVRFAGP